MEPILKWAGGKRLLIPHIVKYINVDEMKKNNNKYYEPFIGGGSIAFHLELNNTIINDSNAELINLYKVVLTTPEQLIEKLKEHQSNYDVNYYKKVRKLDRLKKYEKISDVDKAARLIFLNKTCYNGLYRVNSQGHFNVPMGRYENPDIVCESKIVNLHNLLKNKNFIIRNMDFCDAVADAVAGDVIYFDPPYDYEEKGFTSYNSNGFSKDDLNRLKALCDNLIEKGCKVIISNNDTKYVNNLFCSDNYSVEHIETNRFINCDGKNRKKAKEVIIYGYKR